MKKKFIALLAICPLISFAQEESQKQIAPLSKWEVGFAPGISIRTDGEFYSEFSGLFCTNTTLLRNVGNVQLGIGVPFNFLINDIWEALPQLIVNRTFNAKHVYFYVGGAAGYASRQYILSEYMFTYENRSSRGYVLGLQGGLVHKLGKHLALNAEVALRSTQYWNNRITVDMGFEGPLRRTETHQFFEASAVGSFGLRYRFN
ncbi:MAG: hypothetical protein R2800_13220 [Flavipsychrobacter sp.]